MILGVKIVFVVKKVKKNSHIQEYVVILVVALVVVVVVVMMVVVVWVVVVVVLVLIVVVLVKAKLWVAKAKSRAVKEFKGVEGI